MKQSDKIIHVLLHTLYVCTYLYNTDGLPGQVEAGVEQEGEDKGECSVPTHRRHKGTVLSNRNFHLKVIQIKINLQNRTSCMFVPPVKQSVNIIK